MSLSGYVDLVIRSVDYPDIVRVEVERQDYEGAVAGNEWAQSRIIIEYCREIGVRNKPGWVQLEVTLVSADTRPGQWATSQGRTVAVQLFTTADMFVLSPNQSMEQVPPISP